MWLFTDVFGKQEPRLRWLACKIKLEILGHICAIVSQKGLNIHGAHKFECEEDEDNCLIRQIEKGFLT